MSETKPKKYETKLRTCPLCLGRATRLRPPNYHSYRIACTRCRCNTGGYATMEEAEIAWNNRPDEGGEYSA